MRDDAISQRPILTVTVNPTIDEAVESLGQPLVDEADILQPAHEFQARGAIGVSADGA